MSKEKLKALEAEHRAKLLQDLDNIRQNAGAVHENKAREVFARALMHLIYKTK